MVTFGVAHKLGLPIVLLTTFIDKCMKSMHHTERKIVPYHSTPVHILIVHEAKGKAEKNTPDISQINDQDLV